MRLCVKKISGEIEVQEMSGTQEVLIQTGARDDRALQIVRSDMIATLNTAFNKNESAEKLDINTAGQAAIADRLRDPLAQAGVGLSEDQLQALTKAISDFPRTPHSGLIASIDQLSAVPGVTPKVLNVIQQQCQAGSFAIRGVEIVGPKIGADLRQQAINVVSDCASGHAGLHCVPLRMDLRRRRRGCGLSRHDHHHRAVLNF